MDEQQNDPEEAEATVLPAREAMSIIAPRTAGTEAEGTVAGEESSSSVSQGTDNSNEDTAGSQT